MAGETNEAIGQTPPSSRALGWPLCVIQPPTY